MGIIEVERKFRITPKVRATLSQLPDATKHVAFVDSYFSEELALQDMWLRKRNDTWELKIPASSSRQTTSETCVYRELSGSEVWAELNREGLKAANLLCYAKLRTKRTQVDLKWRSQEFTIVLDECSSDDGFRYDVGEIEILVHKNSDIEDATRALSEVSQFYGIEEEIVLEGKLLEYLKESNSMLYKSLGEAKILPTSAS